MLNYLSVSPVLFVFSLLALLIAITIHEFAHAFTADKLGDPTPRVQGRLTLNPLVHLDPLGTIALLLVGFGWGKPVQFDPYNLANPKKDAAIISFAGPASNLILATVLSIIIQVITNFNIAPHLDAFLYPVVYLNVLLAIFNLIPIHPLDGGKILVALLPSDAADRWDSFTGKYGTYLLLLLVLPIFGNGTLASRIISPTVNFITSLLLPSPGLY